MKIYSRTGTELYDIQVEDKSVRYRSVMNDDSLTLYFSLTGVVNIPVGAYVEFEGQRYTLYYPENLKKVNSRNFEYTVTLHGSREALKLYKFKDVSSTPYRLKFSLTAKPADFLKLLVDVLNIHDSGWTAGSCIDATEKTISFNHESCLDALSRFAQEFNTEYEFVNKTIHLRKVAHFKDTPLALSYGKGNGFKSGVGRTNDGDKQPLGRLYVQGGERNLDYSKYKSKTLLLPKSATLEYNGKTYRTDADGMYITRIGNNNVAEDSYDASNIYPHRVGTVSEVVTVDADKNFYDIKDNSIPEALNYNDCRIPGEKATIKFETGALAGREFDIEQTDNELTGYIHTERRFKIVPAELDGVIMPGGAFVPKVGDKYAIFNVALPQAYISDDATKTGASWEMFREAVRYFAEHEEQKFVFNGKLDGIWSKDKWLEIGGKIIPGGYVLFNDEQFQPQGIKIRITGVKDYINKPHKPEITLSNAPVSGSFGSTLGKLEADEVVVEQKKQEAIQYSKRQWRDAKETMKLLEQLPLNFNKSINPMTVNAMQLLVGDESLQFRFVNNKTNPVRVNHNVVFNKETKTLTASAGILQHLTIGIKVLTNKHKASDYRYWDIEEYISPALEADKAYYLYAKCAKGGTFGTFLLSETAIEMEAVSGYYHLLLGILNSEVNNDRSFASLYGFSEILPGRITTDKIVSQDGKTYFDLVSGTIGGRIKFLSSGAETDLEEEINATVVRVDVEYALSTSRTVTPTTGWNTVAPEWQEGKYMWSRVSTYYKSNPQKAVYSNVTCIAGAAGERGLQGLQGKDGNDGIPGKPGKDGKTQYTHIAYADTASGGGFSQSPAGKAYIGMYVDFVQADSTNPSKYKWSLIKGADGANGVAGKPGKDGRTPYLHIAYANSADGRQGFSVTDSQGKLYIGQYTDYTQADSTDPNRYKWALIKGDKGDRGSDGTRIVSITEEYYLSNSKNTLTGGQWQTTPPKWEYGKYIWTRTRIKYKNPTSEETTTPIVSSEWEAVNELEIGVANLIKDSAWSKTRSAGANNNAYIVLPLHKNLEEGATYTFSSKARFTKGGSAHLSVYGASAGDNIYVYRYGRINNGRINVSLKGDKRVDRLWVYIGYNGSTAGNELELTEYTLVEGNKVGGWIPATSDYTYRISKAQAAADRAAAVTDKLGTVVEGGLVSTITIYLRELASMVETAGVSGIKGALEDNPAFWAGGTHAEAIAVTSFLRKINNITPTAGEYAALAKVALLHSGAAKVGDFIIEESGRIMLVAPESGKPRLIFSAQNIPTLQDLLSTVIFGDSANGGAYSSIQGATTLATVYNVKNGSTITFKMNRIELEARSNYHSNPNTGTALKLELMRNGQYYSTVKTLFIPAATPSQTIVEDVNYKLTGAVAASYYSVQARVVKSSYTTYSRVSLSSSTLAWSFQPAKIRNFVFGLNGFLSFFSDRHIYFSEAAGLDVRGATNLPGILISGRVGRNGGFASVWGAKKHPVNTAVRTRTGEYTVYHSIGHEDYSVVGNAEGGRVVSPYEYRSTYFKVRIYMGGNLSDSNFTFDAKGRNY